MAKHNKIGELGEKIAEQWLKNKGFKILERNYWKKWGEIDIVAQKSGQTHFVEVKTSTWTSDVQVGEGSGGGFRPKTEQGSVRPTSQDDWFRPEENVHPKKLQRLYRTIESYLLEKNVTDEWQLDVAVVYLDEEKKLAKVKFLENIVG